MRKYHTPWRVSPRVCEYKPCPSDPSVAYALSIRGADYPFECAAIEDKNGNGSIALIPLDDSSMEYANKIVDAVNYHEEMVFLLNALLEKAKTERWMIVKDGVEVVSSAVRLLDKISPAEIKE